jgi:cation transport ATPase
MAIFSSASYQMLLLVSLLLVIALIVFRKQLHLSATKVRSSLSSAPTAAVFESLTARTGFNSDVVLHVAASLCKPSEHRLAQAIVNEAKKRQVPMNAVNEFKNHAGYGLTGVVDGRIIALGSHALMQELGIKTQINHAQISQNLPQHSIILYVSVNSYLAGIITVNDTETTSF